MAWIVLLIVTLPIWFAALFVAITYPIAWLIFPSGGTHGPHDTLASRLAGSALSLLAEWWATAWVVMAFPYRFYRNGGARRGLARGKVPVVLLPGHSENALSLLFLERWIERSLRVPVRALSPERYLGDLDRIADEFGEQIHQWMKSLGAERVDLVGHSQGGIIARRLADSADFQGKIRSVITVGSPHLGSALSRLMPGRNARQLRRGSGFLERLNETRPPKGVRFTGICSTHDNLVLPWHCGLSPRGDNFIIRYRGHLTLLFSREVVRLIVRELRAQD